MKKLILLLMVAVVTVTGVFAAPSAQDYTPMRLSDGSSFYNSAGAGCATADITSVKTTVANTATTKTFTAASYDVTIWTATGSSDIHVTFNGATPTTSSATIYGGSGFHHYFQTPITGFKYIGDGTSGELNYVAQ